MDATSPLRAARPGLRPLGRRALVRPGPALAALPRLADRGRARPTPCSTSPPARRSSRSSSCARRTASSSVSTRAPRCSRRAGDGSSWQPRPGRCASQEGDARDLPFEDGQFDALTFTYLLRYVEDPPAVLRELARVVKPGGTIAGLEFGVPHRHLAAGLGAVDACRAAGRGPRDRQRLARGRHVPRAVDPRLLRALAAAAARCRPGARPASRTCARSGSASAAGW